MIQFIIVPVVVIIVFIASFLIANPTQENLIGKRFIATTVINYSGGVIIDDKPIVVKTYKGKILRGEPVLVVGYDKSEDIFWVERYV